MHALRLLHGTVPIRLGPRWFRYPSAPLQTSTIPHQTRTFADIYHSTMRMSGSRRLSRFIKGNHWATGLFLRTPFTEGCAGANKKVSPPSRHQEQASQQRCTCSPTTFSSVQFSSVQFIIQSSVQFMFLLHLVPPFWDLSGSIYAFWFDIMLWLPSHDARVYLVWTLLGIIFFLRTLYSKFSSCRR